MILSPNDLKITKVSQDENLGVFEFEPLPTTFGHTLGNVIRRVLLTSLRGAAVTQFKVDGSVHQFSTLPGIKEDVVEISMNFKKVRARINGNNPVIGTISKKGAGVVTAGDIELSSEAEIVNKDQVIATISDKNAKFVAEVVIEPGTGYSPVEERDTSKVGVILLDALFSPVTSVNYSVEPARFEKRVDLDKLILSIKTDGSISPAEALAKASVLLKEFFARFTEGETPLPVTSSPLTLGADIGEKGSISVDDLSLPTRTINALRKNGIETLGDLAKMSDAEIADIKNLGDKSIEEIKKLLSKEGVR